MEKLLEHLRREHPSLHFTEGRTFYWSPKTRQIFYKPANTQHGLWAVLHETAHALLDHRKYSLDFELIQMEAEAWELAKELALQHNLFIEEDHIQDCLDSYRNWLYKRSICPLCGTKSIQLDKELRYQCFNCHAEWDVARSRFCRPYRLYSNEKSPTVLPVSDFQ